MAYITFHIYIYLPTLAARRQINVYSYYSPSSLLFLVVEITVDRVRIDIGKSLDGSSSYDLLGSGRTPLRVHTRILNIHNVGRVLPRQKRLVIRGFICGW